MKAKLITVTAALMMMAVGASSAHAVVCARGYRGAGCAGPNGAVVARRPAPVVVAPRSAVVVAPAHGCRWVNGVRVCR